MQFHHTITTVTGQMMQAVTATYPNLAVLGSSLRFARSASRNDWGAVCFADGTLHAATRREGLEVLDRVGGGDSFASGLVYGLLAGFSPQRALEYGAAHGALAMTTPGDTSSATLAEVEAVVAGASPRVMR